MITVEEPVLQAEISRAVHKMSWDAQLWFPVVQRQLLVLCTDAADEQIRDAVLAMIENHALVPINPYLPYDWETPISNRTSYPDPSLRRISTSADSQRRQGAHSTSTERSQLHAAGHPTVRSSGGRAAFWFGFTRTNGCPANCVGGPKA